MTPATLTRYLSVRRVADALGVKQQTVLGWIKAGELSALNVGRSTAARKPRWRIAQDDFERFIARRSATMEQRPTRTRRRVDPEVIEFF